MVNNLKALGRLDTGLVSKDRHSALIQFTIKGQGHRFRPAAPIP
jgi:hypothetical protein